MAVTPTVGTGRYDYIDIAKAIGMLTIMWGHIIIGKSVTFVYSFHIPLFFFLSGMVFVKDRYRDFGSFVKRRIKTLIIPYIIYSFITWAIWTVFSYVTHANVQSYWMPLLQTIIAQGSEGYLVHNVPLWFVTCLFLMEMAYYWLAKLPDIWNVTVCILLAALGYYLVNYCEFFDFTTLPWSIDVAMMALIFFCAGNMFAKHFKHDTFTGYVLKHKLVSTIIIIVLFVAVYFGGSLNGKVSMGHANIGNPFIFYPVAYIGVLAILGLSALLTGCLKDNATGRGIKWFGQNSFIAMSIHNPIKGFVIVLLASLLGMNKMSVMENTSTACLAMLVTLTATAVFMLLIVKIKGIIKQRRL